MKRFFKLKSSLWLKIIKLAKVEEGKILPKWLLSIRFLIFPFESIRFYSNKNIDIRDMDTHSFKIQGMRFSFTFFAMLSHHVEKGNYFKIVEKENGFFDIEIVTEDTIIIIEDRQQGKLIPGNEFTRKIMKGRYGIDYKGELK